MTPTTCMTGSPSRRCRDPEGFFYSSTELVEFLKKMSPWLHINYTSDEFARIVYETLEDEQRNGNLRYREMFFSPMDHLVDGVKPTRPSSTASSRGCAPPSVTSV